ncbi:MAG: hypothetical protein GF411_16355 [Candidatus Lokiarchaeota archaeon]|nr:hypothetical protein [Candidatus Lokiarchaeota archaeon]
MSKRKSTTKGASKKRKRKSKKSTVIKTRGIGMAIKLFKYSGISESSTKLARELRDITYEPADDKDIQSGFTKVKRSGDLITADFVAGFRVPVLTYDKNGMLTPQHYVSVDKGTVLIKMDRGSIEVRGSQRIANKFRRILEDITGAEILPMNLNGGTKKLYDEAAEIASVLVSGIDKGNLSQVEFRGAGIHTEEEIGMYTRRYKGEITRFRGAFAYPSGAFLTTSVNAENGSIMLYKSGDGIQEADLQYIVELMENASLEHN